jgi:hypothetical protein
VNTSTLRTAQFARLAIEQLFHASHALDDEGDRRWADEDGWSITIDEESIEVTITRFDRGWIRRWHSPSVESAAEFKSEIAAFTAEAFR